MRSTILSAMLCSLLVLAGCSKNEEEPTTGTGMEQSQSEIDTAAERMGDAASETYGSEATDKAGEIGAMETETGEAASTTLEEADTVIEGGANP
jgi:PBP1b-binding outer membrane lipoprotein LpoB